MMAGSFELVIVGTLSGLMVFRQCHMCVNVDYMSCLTCHCWCTSACLIFQTLEGDSVGSIAVLLLAMLAAACTAAWHDFRKCFLRIAHRLANMHVQGACPAWQLQPMASPAGHLGQPAIVVNNPHVWPAHCHCMYSVTDTIAATIWCIYMRILRQYSTNFVV